MKAALSFVGSFIFLSLLVDTARAELVVVVSAENPVVELSRSELSQIYLGRTNHFPGGERVVPLDQKEAEPAHDAFYKKYLNWSASQVKAYWSKLIFTGRGRPPRSVADGEAMVEAVRENPRAIGYVDEALVGNGLRIVRIE